MKNLSLTFCLAIAVLLASVGGGFASDLPPCNGMSMWSGHNCVGSFIFDNGKKYVGEFKDSKMHGQGTFIWAEGDKYVGEFKNNNQHGQGTYTWANGDKYVGEYRNDKRNGQGTFTFVDGNKYVGEYRDNKRNGQGTFTFAGGDKYVGEFKNGDFNGQGTYTSADGTVKEGIWKDDEFQYAKKLSPPVPVAKTPTQDDEIISASSGSGFAVSSDGYVITNHHVIEGCQKVVVHTKEKDLTVRIITYDPQNDLALLKGDFRPSTVFPLSNNRPELLQDIYVAGFPFGDKFSTSVKVTKGIISSLTGLGNNFSNIQIDAALQSGNSGGPILDDFGNVIGVAVSKLDAKYMFEEFGIIPENTNFGIKSSVVRSVLDSNEVDIPPANQSEISKSKLGKMISSGTYYISCWMTMAQIEKMKTKKVFFSSLD
ncbi:trypsin-like peptidase domain-containing protein [Paracoccaceae bacterium]|nr:trypsin-like peptidase domain-containing protein [Paracoccaceae bacterium]